MVRYDPFDPELIHGDPHPTYIRLRDEAPAYCVERYDCWALSRCEDVWNAVDDPHVSSARGGASGHLLTKVQLGIEEFLARFPMTYETEFVQGYSKLPVRMRPRAGYQAKVYA